MLRRFPCSSVADGGRTVGRVRTQQHPKQPRGHGSPAKGGGLLVSRSYNIEAGWSFDSKPRVPPTVSWFLTPKCNYSCKFCFATFEDIDKDQALAQLGSMMQVLEELKALGFTRITFVGGEPLLHPNVDQLIHAAKGLGMDTSLVTNGSLLTRQRLIDLSASLDVLGFSVDASTDALHATLGRGLKHEVTSQVEAQPAGDTSLPGNAHLARALALCPLAHELGITLKVNTVVTRLNWEDDMTEVIRTMAPARWKIFQALPVEGQNTGSIEPLLISPEQFNQYVKRAQAGLQGTDIPVVPEDNDTMRGSYALIDARGCFFTNSLEAEGSSSCSTGHKYGPSVLQVGGPRAWAAVAPFFDAPTYLERGGVWDYGQGPERRSREAAQAAAAAQTV